MKRFILRFLLLIAAYIALGEIGLRYATTATPVGAPWATIGLAIAALILFGERLWPAVFIGALVVNLSAELGPVTAVGVSAGSTLAAFFAARFAARFAEGVRAFDHARSTFKYSALVGIVAPAIGATVSVAALFGGGVIPFERLSQAWLTWWLGNATGGIILAPFFILWYGNPRIMPRRSKLIESGLFAALLVLFATYALENNAGFLYWIMPVFVWGAFRFRQRETATAILWLTAVFFLGTLYGIGPFFRETGRVANALLLLEASMSTTFVTIMALTATVLEREATEGKAASYAEKMAQERAVDMAIIAGIGEGLIFSTPDGKIAIMNPPAEKMLGLKEGEAIGKPFCEAIEMQDEDGNPIPATDRPLAHALATGRRFAMEPLMPTRYYRRKDGTRFPISYVATPVVMDGRVIGAIDIFRDVTQGKEIDRAKSDFVSLASHQLRTPLSIISMYAELLRRQSGLFEKHDERECRKYSKEIEEATRRMAELINDLLNVSRIDAQTLAVNLVRVDVKKVIGGIIHNLGPKFTEKKLVVSVRYRENLPRLTTDVQLLAIILQNLLTNAIKYTPRGGKVRVSVAAEEGHIKFSVSDTGYGIPKNQHGEIFKKLFRASNVRRLDSEGSGLGLYIAKSMAERLGGSIDFRSVEKKGSVFMLRLPAASSHSQNTARAGVSHEPMEEEAVQGTGAVPSAGAAVKLLAPGRSFASRAFGLARSFKQGKKRHEKIT